MGKMLQRRTSRLFKIAVGGSVAALGGGAALAADGNTPDPTPVEAPTDHVTLDLEDGTVDVAVDDEIAPDLDGEDDGVDQESADSVDEVSVDVESVDSVDSVDVDSVDSVDEESVESVDSVDEDSVDDDDDSAGDDD